MAIAVTNRQALTRAVREMAAEQVPVGSAVFISHFRSGDNPETVAAETTLQSTFGRGRWRSGAEIEALFGALTLTAPGVVPAARWRPHAEDADRDLSVWEELIVAALAEKR
ncbi:SAM-dependent methyltransferase [Nocardia sp. SSK8]|uniref:SAM-dependent methyltransferase n=1 Tax=Nocardia sp. SSK8 TaxID=3120154 RepID=UPI00300B05FA